jgi:hypothetical protein
MPRVNRLDPALAANRGLAHDRPQRSKAPIQCGDLPIQLALLLFQFADFPSGSCHAAKPNHLLALGHIAQSDLGCDEVSGDRLAFVG